MLRVISCLTNEHDFKLVVLAMLICGATSFATFHAFSYAVQVQGVRRLAWVHLTALATGAGIWATHFVAMLAYSPGVAVNYDLALTTASLLIAAVVAIAGFWLASLGGAASAAAGGTVIGFGIALMHFTGMHAVEVPGKIAWDTGLVVSANVIGIGLSAGALLAWHELENRRGVWAGAALLTAAICALHFVAMGAVTIVPDPTIVVSAGIDESTLAVAVSAVAMVVVLALLAATHIIGRAERVAFALNQELVDAALEGLIVAKDGRILNVNRQLVTLTGQPQEALLGRGVVGDLLTGAVETSAPSSEAVEALLQSATGVAIPVEVVRKRLSNGARGDEVFAIRDLTERRRAEQELRRHNEALRQREEELRRQNQRFEDTLANMPHGLTVIDRERRLVTCNKRYMEMYGVPASLARPGTRIADIFEHLVTTGVYSADDAAQFEREGTASLFRPAATLRKLADGRAILVSRGATDDGGWIAIHDDVTERERLNAKLAQQNALLKQNEAKLEAQNASLDRALAERAAQKADLDAALAHMSHGLAMFNAAEQLVVANARYAEVYGLGAEDVRPGMTLHQLVAQRIAVGLYAGMTTEEVVNNMRKYLAREQASTFVSRLGNGRILSVAVHPRSNGGWVVTLQDITEREQLNAQLTSQNELLKQREAELATRNEQLDVALENMRQGLALFDAEQRLIICNRRYAEMYGLTPEQVKPGTTVRQVFDYRLANGRYHVGDAEGFVDSWAGGYGDSSARIQELANGRIVSVYRQLTPSGGTVVTHEDVTERQRLNLQLEQQNRRLKEQEEKLRSQNVQLDAALENMLQGLAMYDSERRLVVCNRRYAEMYGLPPELVQPGTSLQAIIAYRIANGEFPGRSAAELIDSMLERVQGDAPVTYTSDSRDGRHIAVSVQPMPGGGTVTTHHDITEIRHSEAKIAHMARHDALTGLPNRALLNERLEDALRRVKRGEVFAVHLLDLDRFKIVNDTMGHPAGDALLKMVAARLRLLVRETDTIARMGGDEFTIVQTAIAQPAAATLLAHRVIEALSAPYEIEGQQAVIGTSVGIAIGPLDGENPDQLMRNADLALYRAKGDGRGTYRFFERAMDTQMQMRRRLESDLRGALAAGQFELHYQPVVNLASNEVIGFEALIRWRHPENGLVPPRTFIPLAEEIGFIVQIGDWVVRQACMTAARWPRRLTVAVNLSPAQFRSPGLAQMVVGALAASGLPADRLELEITESTLLQDSESTLATLFQLRAIGVRITMDDFGTGYSSLSYLQSFPFDRIKIDRSFVKDIAEGVGSLNIVRAVAAMANGLGMATTAEGVETDEQLETIKAEGCTDMQGFIFSKPMPAEEVERFLRERERAEDNVHSGPRGVDVDAA